jgi:hypothetical protein
MRLRKRGDLSRLLAEAANPGSIHSRDLLETTAGNPKGNFTGLTGFSGFTG